MSLPTEAPMNEHQPTTNDHQPTNDHRPTDEPPDAELSLWPAPLDEQAIFPEQGWDHHTIAKDRVALAILHCLDYWRRTQDCHGLDCLLVAVQVDLELYGLHRAREGQAMKESSR